MSKSRRLVPFDDSQAPFYAGIDVGGTNIKFGLIDNEGSTLAYHSITTDAERGPEYSIRRMADIVQQLVHKYKIDQEDFPRIGLATPGTMDVPNGLLLEPHNLPKWWHCPIRDLLSHYSGRPVTFVNDANAAAYGEYWSGTGQQVDSMILLTLGTGIGGGIIINNELIVGEHSCGGEVGHIIIDSSKGALKDNAGKPGSLEAYASAGGVVLRTQAKLNSGIASSIADRLKDGETLTPLLIAEEAGQKDELAVEIVMDTAKYLGIGIASLVHTVDPESVVLGGAMTFGGKGSSLGDAFLEQIREECEKNLLGSLKNQVSIDFASLGGDAGFIGAAGLAKVDHEKEKG